jgi:glyceraldehyde 3-phosphate dehydrogenase
LLDISISEILNLHEYAKKVVNRPIDVFTTSELAEELYKMNLAPAKLDIGKLASEWLTEGSNFASKQAFLDTKIGQLTSADGQVEPRDVVLYGFGRIGRLAARELIKQAGKGQQLRLRAIVTRSASDAEITKRAALLRNDSVHNDFKGTVSCDYENKALIVNGQIIKMIAAANPEDVDYTKFGINNALVIDNTGVFEDRTALSRHLKAKGVSKVLLTAPGKELPNVVYGINQTDLDDYMERKNVKKKKKATSSLDEFIGDNDGELDTTAAP